MNPDVLIIGGGAIGLSLAYELARDGASVRVLDRGLPGQESSWAGAGIIPVAASGPTATPYEQLTALSHTLHAEWALRLRDETEIDNGYRRCGGLYLARNSETTKSLQATCQVWQRQGLAVEMLAPATLAQHEPHLTAPLAACLVRDEAQLRNPRHLKALLVACQRRGVVVSPGVEVGGFETQDSRIRAVLTSDGVLSAAQFCICGGAWSRLIATRLGAAPPIKPIRGQIVLLDRGALAIRHIVNEGACYLVPRDDGRLLVGSTEEDVGFEKGNTGEGVGGLLEFARSLIPALGEARFERAWSGLRPASADGLPFLGRVPNYDNGWIAAGHFRAGLSLSCATAVLMSQSIRGRHPQLDITPFCIGR